ncbi:MAG TPA: hypothetical protein VKB04_02850 [Anaerolineales bacterium]|nr:hypothetical protein [Anaerolineales bacterium]
MSKMSRLAKLGLVIGGYIAACLVAYGAVYINDLFMDPAVLQASSGMSAFGDLILFVGVFGVLALFPTGLMLYFLVRKFLTQ